MKDEMDTGMYDAKEYQNGGYPQLRKKPNCRVITQQNAIKASHTTFLGLWFIGLAVLSIGSIVCSWLM